MNNENKIKAYEYLQDNINSYFLPFKITTNQAKKVAKILGYDYNKFNKTQKKFFKMDCICSYQNSFFSTPLFDSLIK